VGKNAHVIGVSIGVVSISEDSGSLVDILKAADAACYAAKEGGRNRIHIYREHDAALATRHGEMQWVARINLALEENRLHLTLQPIAPLQVTADEHYSYEVLLRMQEDNGNIVLPIDFLGAAERYNLSIKLDRWVIRTILNGFRKTRRNWIIRPCSRSIFPANRWETRIFSISR